MALQLVPARPNTNGGFMSSVKQDEAARGRGGGEVHPRCHGIAEARRVPRPFPLVQIGGCFQPSRAESMEGVCERAHDEKQIGKGEMGQICK